MRGGQGRELFAITARLDQVAHKSPGRPEDREAGREQGKCHEQRDSPQQPARTAFDLVKIDGPSDLILDEVGPGTHIYLQHKKKPGAGLHRALDLRCAWGQATILTNRPGTTITLRGSAPPS